MWSIIFNVVFLWTSSRSRSFTPCWRVIRRFSTCMNRPFTRDGVYRASSIYTSALSLGEYAAMMLPLSFYFLLHSRRSADRLFGWAVIVACFACLVTSNSRGGYIAAIVAAPIFTALWIVRKARFGRADLTSAFVLLIGTLGFAAFGVLIFTWNRLHNSIIGNSYDAQASTQARFDQWNMAVPHILSNPFTGHGFGIGADIVGYVTPSGFPNSRQFNRLLSGRDRRPGHGILLRFGCVRHPVGRPRIYQ